MINKRLLIKNLLTHHSENSFYDKKRQLNLHNKEGKAKFLKHICALSNSNPFNNSYIVVGVEDDTNEIVGTDFFDDSRIQNLVNAYLENPPNILYENVPFSQLPENKVVGLVTIKPKNKSSFFKKNIYTIPANTHFIRIGSNSLPQEGKTPQSKSNIETVISIENNSRNSIKNTLENVIQFIHHSHKNLDSEYQVFKENFVVCWAGQKKKYKENTFWSRVDIELINEQVKLFYSFQDEVTINYSAESFVITEWLSLGLTENTTRYPFEELTINFYDNGYYKIETKLIFEIPIYNRKILYHIYINAVSNLKKFQTNQKISEDELLTIPRILMISYLNQINQAKILLISAKDSFKNYSNSQLYVNFKEAMRVLRKLKYEI
jgi:hypothetical protein